MGATPSTTLSTAWREALRRLASPEPAELYRWFRIAFGWKLFLVALVRDGGWDLASLLLVAVLLAAVVNLGAPRRYLPGAAVFAAYSLWVVVEGWPFPINHHFFEALAMLVILLLPAPRGSGEEAGGEDASTADADGLAVHVLQYSILSLFFYSGLQKVVHGYYLSGELFTLHALYVPDFLGDRLRGLAAFVGGLFGADPGLPLEWSAGYTGQAVTADPWLISLLHWTGIAVVLSEIAAPLLVAWRRTRGFGLALLILVQLGIAVSSNEIGIAFVSLSCIFLFLRRGYRAAYLLLMLAMTVFYVAVLINPGLL